MLVSDNFSYFRSLTQTNKRGSGGSIGFTYPEGFKFSHLARVLNLAIDLARSYRHQNNGYEMNTRPGLGQENDPGV